MAALPDDSSLIKRSCGVRWCRGTGEWLKKAFPTEERGQRPTARADEAPSLAVINEKCFRFGPRWEVGGDEDGIMVRRFSR